MTGPTLGFIAGAIGLVLILILIGMFAGDALMEKVQKGYAGFLPRLLGGPMREGLGLKIW